jgi:AsmA-like C-terminal region/AsmA family
MKKLLLVVGVLGLLLFVLVLGVVGYGFHLVGQLKTPEFKASLLQKARDAAGTNVEVQDLDISLFSGVTLKGVRVDNPPPFKGPLLSADAFVLKYKLRPLLSKRFEVEDLSLTKPVVALSMDAKGGFNYERLGGASKPAAGSAPAKAGDSSLPLTLVLSKLSVSHADVSMTDATKATLLKVQDANFDSAFEIVGGAATGKGDARIAAISMADMLFLRDVKTRLEVSPSAVKLAPLGAQLAGGQAGGDMTLDLKNFRYTTNLDVKSADVKTLISEAKAAGGVEGKLVARASFEGTGGMETLKGKGHAEIAGCRVTNSKVLTMLSSVLRLPELASPDFKECIVDFQMARNKVTTPKISLKSAALQLTGSGTMDLATSGLNYDLNLALSNAMLDKIPVREMRAAFKDRGDGFGATDFKVTGTSAAPQNDLAGRVGKAAATQAVQQGVGKLLGGKRLFGR